MIAQTYGNDYSGAAHDIDPDLVYVRHTDYAALHESHARLVKAASRCLALPRPWIRGDLTWEEWDKIFTDIDEALRLARELEEA